MNNSFEILDSSFFFHHFFFKKKFWLGTAAKFAKDFAKILSETFENELDVELVNLETYDVKYILFDFGFF